MVATQALIKARQSLLQVIFCTTPTCENAWTRKLWSAVHLPYKTWHISSRSRATTATDKKAWCTRKLSCCFANSNLLLLTVSFVAIVFVWRPCNHLCFKSCPTFRNTLTYRKTFHTVLRDILEWPQKLL